MTSEKSHIQRLSEILIEINGETCALPGMLDYRLRQSEELFSALCNKKEERHIYEILSAGVAVLRAKEEKTMFTQSGGLIATGPFKGMKYLPYSLSSLLAPKLLGTYEQELTQYLHDSAHLYESFIDIGCAEGYYLSGMSFINPSLVARGVDVDDVAVSSANLLCSLNKLENAKAFGCLETAMEAITGDCLFLIDVDGCEIEVIQRVTDLIGQKKNHKSFKVIVETDLKPDGSSNRLEIIDFLGSKGLKVVQELEYDIKNRFIKETLGRSDLERFVLAYERSITNQSWIIAEC